MDFGDLKTIVNKEIVDKFDHVTVFNKNTPHVQLAETLKKEGASGFIGRLSTNKRMYGNRFCQNHCSASSQKHSSFFGKTSRNRHRFC